MHTSIESRKIADAELFSKLFDTQAMQVKAQIMERILTGIDTSGSVDGKLTWKTYARDLVYQAQSKF